MVGTANRPRRTPLTLTVASMIVCLAAMTYQARAQAVQPIGMILAVGDIAECLTIADKANLNSKNAKARERAEQNAKNKTGAATAELIRQQIAKAKEKDPQIAVRILALGDLAYPCGATSAFSCFNETWGQFEADKILLPVPGNHEYEHKKGTAPNDVCVTAKAEKTPDRYHAQPFFKYFENNDFAKKSQGFSVLRFPDKDKGPWALVGLNPYAGLSVADLKARLEGEEKDMRCVLTFAHAPFYSSGRHGHADSSALNAPLALQGLSKATFEALYQARVSVLVAGHDHHYEQLGRAKANGVNADLGAAAIDKDRGVRSFVVGTGGTNLYSAKYTRAWTFREAYDLQSRGILKITLYPASYDWEFIPTKDNKGSFKSVTGIKFEDSCNRS